MTAAGGRVATGGTEGDAYGYYVHQKALNVAVVIELMNLGLVSVVLLS